MRWAIRCAPRPLLRIFECIAAGTSAGSEPTPAQTNVNFTFVDSGATWIIRAMPDSTTRGDIGIYTGVNFEPLIYPAGANQVVGNTVQVDNLNQRAIGSASGFVVMGAVKCTTTGVLSQSFSTTDLILARDGLLLGNTSGLSDWRAAADEEGQVLPIRPIVRFVCVTSRSALRLR